MEIEQQIEIVKNQINKLEQDIPNVNAVTQLVIQEAINGKRRILAHMKHIHNEGRARHAKSNNEA